MRHPSKGVTSIISAAALLSMPGVCRAGTPYLVGSVAAATNVLLIEGVGIYHFSTGEIPTSVLAAGAPERYVYFGVPVPLTFNNAIPGASYQVDAVFSSDNTRVQTLSLNGTHLGSSFTLPAQSRTNLSWYCGNASSSTLAFVLENTTGPNAVVSSVKIYSSNPTLLTPPPTNIAFTIPRLSPLPATVAGISSPRLDLGGTWQFRTAASAGFPTSSSGTWETIQVPGEWVMQGFTVASGANTAYRRSFVLPSDWSGARVKLRFDAVYSSCQVWVNEQAVGRHLGGFTPFELDITGALQAGTNRIELTVVNESEADTLASGSQYAVHPLGGITRKVMLFAVPAANVAALHVLPQVAANLLTASAEVRLSIANESGGTVGNAVAIVEVCPVAAGVTNAPVARSTNSLPTISPGNSVSLTQVIPVPSPHLWHPEKPNLYVARLTLQRGGTTVETTARRFGLRRIDVIGNQLLLNSTPVKAAGICRQETHPLLGRSLSPDWSRFDAQLFMEMNANHVRTTHYPPAEEFIDACDELGLTVQEEAPFCWANSSSGLLTASTIEMANRDLSHPSILFWSLANESTWTSGFYVSSLALREFDSSRPQTFNEGASSAGLDSAYEIESCHYPSPSHVASLASYPKPVNIGEYSHVYDYDHSEVLTDPGLRDLWGLYHRPMWEVMWQSQAILGGCIWAGMDDTFLIPQADTTRIPVGYGAWGLMDGWRRPKPEYWHAKRAYSPLRLLTTNLPPGGATVTLPVQNRHAVTALNELTVDYAWLTGTQVAYAGQISNLLRLDPTACYGAPGATGAIAVPMSGSPAGSRQLYVRWTSPRGFVVDEWVLRDTTPASSSPPGAGAGTLTETANTVTLQAGGSTWTLDKQTGLLTGVTTTNGGSAVRMSGPFLMLLPDIGQDFNQFTLGAPAVQPSNAVCSGWGGVSVQTKSVPNPMVQVRGSYAQAVGTFTIAPTNGGLLVGYDFILNQSVTPRQVGLVFELPGDWNTLAWQRDAELDIYPPDHIGRPTGQAVATNGTLAGILGPTNPPALPWALDLLPQGNNDFRSTKRNIRYVALSTGKTTGLEVLSDGAQVSRAWIENGNIRLLIADQDDGGAPLFFNTELSWNLATLNSGDHVTGHVFIAPTASSALPPRVALTSPVSGQYFVAGASIPLSAGVTDNGHIINRVDYYINGVLAASSSVGGSYNASVASAPACSNSVVAAAVYDNTYSLTSAPPANIFVLRPLSIATAAKLANSSFTFAFTGTPGQPFKVLATNSLGAPLATWPVLISGTIGQGGWVTFTDSAASTNRRQFYGLTSP